MPYVVLDIETDSRGARRHAIVEDTRAVLSIQLKPEGAPAALFHKNGTDGQSLDAGIDALNVAVATGKTLVGYNVKAFDLPLLRRFFGFDAPAERVAELLETRLVADYKDRHRLYHVSLARLAHGLGIDAPHKDILKPWQAKCPGDGAAPFVLMYDDYARAPSETADFYRYAIGDVLVEEKVHARALDYLRERQNTQATPAT